MGRWEEMNGISEEEMGKVVKQCREDPIFFIRNVLGWDPWGKQIEILESFKKKRRVCVRSGNGVGKTKIAAGKVLHTLFTKEKSRVITTAPSWLSLTSVLWGEIRSQYKNAIIPLGGTCLETAIKTLDDTHYAIGLSTDEPEKVAGHHGKSVLIVVDEASGIEDRMLEALEQLMTGEDSEMLYIGNPIRTDNRFYRSFYDPVESQLFEKVHISCFDSPNVIEGKEVIPGLVGKRWIEERLKEYGNEDNAWYQSHVLGDFPVESEDQLISSRWINDAEELVIENNAYEQIVMAIDVARLGDDSTVFLIRQGDKVLKIEEVNHKRIPEIVGKAIILAKDYSPQIIVVDDIGVGGGCTDYLLKYNSVGFIGNAETSEERFLNLRAEYYWKLRNKFMNKLISIPKGTRLSAELCSIIVKYEDKIKIQSKKEMKKSPNFSDAMMMSEYGLAQVGYTEIKRKPVIFFEGTLYDSNYSRLNLGTGGYSRTGYG